MPGRRSPAVLRRARRPSCAVAGAACRSARVIRDHARSGSRSPPPRSTLDAGEDVELRIKSDDTSHGFRHRRHGHQRRDPEAGQGRDRRAAARRHAGPLHLRVQPHVRRRPQLHAGRDRRARAPDLGGQSMRTRALAAIGGRHVGTGDRGADLERRRSAARGAARRSAAGPDAASSSPSSVSVSTISPKSNRPRRASAPPSTARAARCATACRRLAAAV